MTAFFKKHMSTRKKELFAGILIWIMGLIWTNPKSAFTWPYMFLGLLAGLLGILAMVSVLQIYYPSNEKTLQKDPPLLKLLLKPKDKTKWLVFLVFLALLIPTILFKSLLHNPTVFRYFLTALMGFLSVLLLECLKLWGTKK